MSQLFYLGPAGSYSYEAAKQYAPKANLVPCVDFNEIIDHTLRTPGALGILPLENSITSSVHDNLDRLFEGKLYIVDEIQLKIELNLIGLAQAKISDVKTVISHPKALAQCQRLIEKYNFNTQTVSSTAQGCELVLQNKDVSLACLGSVQLAKQGLQILQKDAGDQQENYTRFVFISTQDKPCSGEHCKMIVICTLKHEPGSLAKLLTRIADAQGNLTKIESRPIPNNPWHYRFWLEIVASSQQTKIIQQILKKYTEGVKIVGSYSI